MRCSSIVALGLTLAATAAVAQSNLPQELEELRNPRIVERAAQKMLVVEAQGDPRTVGAGAFGLLFQLYFRIPETPKGPGFSAPRARWPVDFDQPRSEWVGHYALPVPDSVTAVPEHSPPPGLHATLAVWEYGETAEVLHIGPYDREEPTIQRLRDHVEAQGYVLAGVHEEEYLLGPTMSGPGNPEEYLTILRYPVAKPSP